jgi:hypothetical protein
VYLCGFEENCSSQNLSLIKQIRELFGTKLADEVSLSDLESFIVRRQKQDYTVAATNRIIQCLRRAYNLAETPFPKIKLPSEKGIREPVFSRLHKCKKFSTNLPDDGLRDFIRFLYSTGLLMEGPNQP